MPSRSERLGSLKIQHSAATTMSAARTILRHAEPGCFLPRGRHGQRSGTARASCRAAHNIPGRFHRLLMSKAMVLNYAPGQA
jgi:hypothetical protein